jgi:hypothetical protein
MTRQILVSASPAAPRPDGDSAEFGRWLTNDLRPKGAPKESRPRAPVVLPSPDAPDPQQAEFARWLTHDLRPRGSSMPPPDSLSPQLLPELEAAPPPLAPHELDDDDLSVLPARSKALALFGSRERRRSLAVLGVLLLASGFFLMRGSKPVTDLTDSAAAADASGVAVVLPPPPPDEPSEEADPVVELDATGRPRPAAPQGPPVDPEDPRFRLGGPSVGRFPDLPPPTLSRLAREELQQARERDEAARKAAKRTAPASPTLAPDPF